MELLLLQKQMKEFLLTLRDRSLAFKNKTRFSNCIAKINNVLIDNAEGLDVVMPMYNLFEHSKNYKKQQAIYGITIGMNLIVFLLIIKMQIP